MSNKDTPAACNVEKVSFISPYTPEESMSQKIMSCCPSNPLRAASNNSSLAPHVVVL